MRFFEVDTSTLDAVMSAAMLAQGRASQSDKVARLSMPGFLQMINNAGVMLSYDGLKSLFDGNPSLKNVISKFNKDSITFSAGDSNDDSSGYEEPTGDTPPDERVANMAKKALATRESIGEAKDQYKLYHDTYSGAVQHALGYTLEKTGYSVDQDEFFNKVSSGPRKPSSGKTNSFSLQLVDASTGKPVNRMLHMQIYNMDDKKYELNMYVDNTGRRS